MKLRLILAIGLAIVVAAGSILAITGCSGTTEEVATYLIVQSDTVSGSGCFQTNFAHRGENFVWRTRVVDPLTNLDMTDEHLESVIIKLADGTELSATYGDHGDMEDAFWADAWEVPLDFPLGAFTYTVEATAKDGRTGTYHQNLVAPSLLTIEEYDSNYVARRSVNIENNLFDPSVITVTQGGAVRWTNRDQVTHSVVGDDFDTGDIVASERAQHVFDTAGTFQVHCGIHPAETATVIVQSPF